MSSIGLLRVFAYRVSTGVHAVEAIPPPVAALADLHVDPVGLPGKTREGEHPKISDAGRNLLRHDLAECPHHGVGELVAGAEAGDGRGREDRVGEAALGGHDLDGAGEAVVDRDVAMHRGIEQNRSNRQPHRDVDGADERHVDGPIRDLVGGPGEVDRHLVALDDDRGHQRQLPFGGIRAVQEPVNCGSRPGKRRRAACRWPSA